MHSVRFGPFSVHPQSQSKSWESDGMVGAKPINGAAEREAANAAVKASLP